MQVQQIIQRPDGSERRITAYGDMDFGVGVYVHRRESPLHDWELTCDRPHPDWRKMSVDDYVKHGRSEMLQAVTPGEILKVTSALLAM